MISAIAETASNAQQSARGMGFIAVGEFSDTTVFGIFNVGADDLGSGSTSLRAVFFFGLGGTGAAIGGAARNSAEAGLSTVGFLKSGGGEGFNDVDADCTANVVVIRGEP